MAKRIAVFSDGTGQTIGRNESNVLRLCKMLDLSEHSEQVAIYDPGIGTHVSFHRLQSGLKASERMRLADSNPSSQLLHRLRMPLELCFGAGAKANIKQLYLALIDAYESGDQIYLFCFSRGAFTVRALAGLIYRCGLLKRDAVAEINTAWGWCQKHYTSFENAERESYRAGVDAFRRKFSRPCDLRFLGIWDTVKSVGYIHPMNFPHTRHNPIVETVRHALAFDERRSFYAPTTWGGLVKDTRPAVHAPASFDLDETDDPPGKPQDVKEVWFPGNHADVGGGYPAGENGPANNSLRWMIAEARDCGLNFSETQYSAIFPRDQDEDVEHRHDEMQDSFRWKVVWWLADRTPRWDLQNEPPPPVTKFSHKPAGPRKVADSMRGGKVSVHETARNVYAESTSPWHGVPMKFVPTHR